MFYVRWFGSFVVKQWIRRSGHKCEVYNKIQLFRPFRQTENKGFTGKLYVATTTRNILPKDRAAS